MPRLQSNYVTPPQAQNVLSKRAVSCQLSLPTVNHSYLCLDLINCTIRPEIVTFSNNNKEKRRTSHLNAGHSRSHARFTSEPGICISGCEVHRCGSTYFATFLATELESTSDASPEPEEPADDTHHSNINRTKAEDRVDEVIVVLSNVRLLKKGTRLLLEGRGSAMRQVYIEKLRRPKGAAEGSFIEVNEEIITAAVSPLFNKFTEVKVSRSQGILLDEGYDREGSFKELQNTTTDFAEAMFVSSFFGACSQEPSQYVVAREFLRGEVENLEKLLAEEECEECISGARIY
ncbi:hypothetical protein Tco_0726796 [Tanacetum coccineum]|uniref:Uncharacterized protein n=1 Tax=Tanacetum coccineum TaxID=301880 RepID=A0ABQ4YIW5_9ASTR